MPCVVEGPASSAACDEECALPNRLKIPATDTAYITLGSAEAALEFKATRYERVGVVLGAGARSSGRWIRTEALSLASSSLGLPVPASRFRESTATISRR
jgi:hypothetical protein